MSHSSQVLDHSKWLQNSLPFNVFVLVARDMRKGKQRMHRSVRSVVNVGGRRLEVGGRQKKLEDGGKRLEVIVRLR